MKAKPRIVWVDTPSAETDNDLEDGELQGEKAEEYDAITNPPRKQRKLAHSEDTIGKAGRLGSGGADRPASKQEPYSQDRRLHHRSHPEHGHHLPQLAFEVSGKRKDKQRHDPHHSQPQPSSHREPHRDRHHFDDTGTEERKGLQNKSKQHQQHQQHQHVPAGTGVAAGASKSAAFEARKAALKARLESLAELEVVEPEQDRRPGTGKVKQLAAAAAGGSPAAAWTGAGGGGGGGGGKYVAEVYKEVVPSVEIKGAVGGSGSGGSSPHPIRLADVQSLVMWVLSPAGNLVEAPRWAFVKNKPLVEGAVLVLASGLSSAMMREKRHLLPFLSSLGRTAVVHTSPQAKPAQNTAELLTTKVTLRNAKRKRSTGEGAAAAAAAAGGESAAGGGGSGGAAVLGQQKGLRAQEGAGGGGSPDGDAAEGSPRGGGAARPPPPPPPPSSVPHLPPGPFPPSHYVATLEQLKQHNYPLPVLEDEGEGQAEEEGGAGGGGGAAVGWPVPPGRLVCPPGFVATRPSGHPAARERMVALDCEMCITEAGFELTRITLVAGPGWEPGTAAGEAAAQAAARRHGANGGGGGAGGCGGGAGSGFEDEDDGQGEGDSFGGGGGCQANGGGGKGFPSGAVLMDELVVPERPILDYNTRYSGITAQMLQGCSNRLEDVRERFLSLVPSETLLVGHALENDLAALMTCHCRVLDTAILFPHPKGPPFKSALKILARRFLRRTIQDGAHDSAVDARTALDLALLKIKHGPSYGCCGSGPHSSAPKLAELLTAQCGTRCCLVDRHDVLGRFVSGSTAAVPVASDDDAVAAAGRQVASRMYGFVWTQLTELAVFLFRRAKHKARLEEAEAAAASAAKAKAETAVRTVAEAKAAAAARGSAHSLPAANGRNGGSTTAGAVAVGEGGTLAVGTAASNETSAAANGSGATTASEPPDYSDAVLDEMLVSYNRRLRQLWEALPPRYMLVIATGAGDTAEYDRLYEQKCKRSNRELGLPRWTRREEDALLELGAQALQSLCFAAVKEGGGGGSGGGKAAAASGN